MAKLPPFVIDRPYGRVAVVIEVYGDGNDMIAGIYDIKGRIRLRPMSKRWFAVIRGHLHRIERIVRRAGCKELRVAGRDWSRILPDYEPLDGGADNLLRKVL